ncbi:hypothetical protein Tco_0089437 [Tanacetum coccineum]
MKAIVEEGESSEDDWNHYSQLTNLKDQEHEPLINIGDNFNYNPYLGVNRIFGRNGRARNISDIQDEREPKDHDGISDLQCNSVPHQEPLTCKIEKFKVIKYSFGPAQKFISIRECGYQDCIRTEENACNAYQDNFLMMDEG